MNDFYTHAVTVFLGFFAVMNPIANTAVFSSLVGDKEKQEQRRIAGKALLITFVVILMSALLGKFIFHMFGITIPALRITGGILVFMVGYQMLTGEESDLHSGDRVDDRDITISPLAMPLLAGPGTIVTAMNYSASGQMTDILTTVSVFLFLCVLTYVCFVFSGRIIRAVGPSGLNIITRLMGLILAVIGTQMGIVGINEAFGLTVLTPTQ